MSSTASNLNSGDTAWVLAASALVMIMTPGVGFFYGGLVRHKNLVSTIGQCYITFAIVTMVWYLLSFSLVFSPTSNANGFWGDLKYAALQNVGLDPDTFYGPTIPFQVFFFFQLKFAAITPALIVGSVTERIKFSSLLVFIVTWSILVYGPVGHWVWSENGWLAKLGAIDFAGGTVVHINSGCAALAAAIVTGKGKDKGDSVPCNIPLVLLGDALLWFGWFGFNGGSALSAGGLAASACVVTNTAAAAAGLAWMGYQYVWERKVSIVGFATGSVCGLVAITPASGYVTNYGAVVIGIFGALFPYMFCLFKKKYDLFDDTLDAFGCHGIAGIWGTFGTGLFATLDINPNGADGAFYGNPSLLWKEIVALIATVSWSFIGSVIILLIIKRFMGLRVSEEHELQGLDMAILRERAMEMGLTAASSDEKLLSQKIKEADRINNRFELIPVTETNQRAASNRFDSNQYSDFRNENAKEQPNTLAIQRIEVQP